MLGTSTISRTIESHCFVPEPMHSILILTSVQTSGPTHIAGSSTCISGRIAPPFSASNSDAGQQARSAWLQGAPVRRAAIVTRRDLPAADQLGEFTWGGQASRRLLREDQRAVDEDVELAGAAPADGRRHAE